MTESVLNPLGIDTGDTVFHRPTCETWLVAYVRDDRLAWLGWPEGEAYLNDCLLVDKATEAERDKWLQIMADGSKDSARRRYARYCLGPIFLSRRE